MGVHAALLVRSPPISRLLLSLVILWLNISLPRCTIALGGGALAADDSNTLLKFKESLLSSTDMNDNERMRSSFSSWNSNANSTRPCTGNYANWVGVLCFDGIVYGLQLENMNLSGDIDVDSLLLLPNLRTLSFMNNNLDGPLPEFRKLTSLKSLYLSNNQFSGQIHDDAFAQMTSLKKLYLSNNQFRGTIPSTLGQLPKLLDLGLEDNQFVGRIPNFSMDNHFKLFNVSNNQLEGLIPASLAHLSSTSFSGNKDLCGKPLDVVCKFPTNVDSPPPNANSESSSDAASISSDHHEFSMIKAILIIVSFGLVIGLIILVVTIIYHRRRNQTPRLGHAGSSSYNNQTKNVCTDHMAVATAASTSHHHHHMMKNRYEEEERNQSSPIQLDQMSTISGTTARNSNVGGGKGGKLSFIREDRRKFDLQDLLRASAEILGSGNFGSSYKAVLMDEKYVVVKRFKQMNSIDRQEFNEHMIRLGTLIHPNLLPLVAYYYRKEEKLLVFDHVANGSLASQLHGNRKLDQPGLDWPTRLKVVKGVAKGMYYLYKELPSLLVPHAHLKSSNVLLDESFNPLLMDYTLVPVMNQEHARRVMIAYRSPEYIQHGRLTKKTDVWSLGILILELLTGKFPPPNYLATTRGGGGEGGDLLSWVDCIVKEAEALQVFDKELLVTGKNSCEGEMLKLFQIGMACCEEDVGKRLDMEEAVDKIQELKEKDGPDTNTNYHTYNRALL